MAGRCDRCGATDGQDVPHMERVGRGADRRTGLRQGDHQGHGRGGRRRLANTPTIARTSYIHPAVIALSDDPDALPDAPDALRASGPTNAGSPAAVGAANETGSAGSRHRAELAIAGSRLVHTRLLFHICGGCLGQRIVICRYWRVGVRQPGELSEPSQLPLKLLPA